VLAVGNPFNLTSTVTAGIISAKGRNIGLNEQRQSYAIESFIQTDAAVNPGNSGGALVNPQGLLVGINTAIASRTGYFTGYSFAIPVNLVKKVVADLIEFGTVQRAMLGISINEIDAQFAKTHGIEKPEGIYISSLESEGSAKAGGLQEGDIILKIDDAKVNTVPELQEQIGRHRPGDKINITIRRNSETKEMKIILKNKMGTTKMMNSDFMNTLGADFEVASPVEKQRLQIANGVKVVRLRPTSIFKQKGIRENFIITSINHQTVKTVDDVQNLLQNARGGVYIEGVYPDGMVAYYAFGLK
jgi:serine protease Do